MNTCRQCGKSFYVSPSRINKRYSCSRSCYSLWQETHPSNTGRTHFKPGISSKNKGIYHNDARGYIDGDGYQRSRIKGVSILEHRQVWLRDSEWHTIPMGWVVHHKNGTKTDNRIDNLSCIPIDVHVALHQRTKNQGDIL